MISKLISKNDTTQFTKYLVFTFMFMVFCAFETSFWPNLINFIPAPQLWLLFVFYILRALDRTLEHFLSLFTRLYSYPFFVDTAQDGFI